MSLNDRTTPAATLGPHPATIRTFHPRRGRLSSRHLDALDRLWPWYGLDVPDAPSASIDPASEPADDNEPAAPTGEPTNPIELVELFGRDAPVVLEIGSGMGEATAAMAAADPGRNYLAVEVHTPGIANLLAMIERRELTNLRIADGDALVLLRHLIQPAALAAVNVFFPDPWPKARHHKRRLIQPAHVPVLRDRLAPGGCTA